MYKIAKAAGREREILFLNTAAKKGMHVALIEKDFWVCLTLDYLFHRCPWREAFAFKGGTSLSKAYKLIERFSEDIDLILDWRVLGYGKDEPWAERSKSSQRKFNEEANARTAVFLREKFLPSFKADMENIVGKKLDIYIDAQDGQTVHFAYPYSYTDTAIVRTIRLEIGALAAWTPTQLKTITSYAAEEYENVFIQPTTEILTTTAARSFWEKATILHAEAFRPEGSVFPHGYSRHYYDLYVMAHSSVKKEALAQIALLKRVVDFKQKFYTQNRARYDLAVPGTLRLLPPHHSATQLKEDYAGMRRMIFGKYPSYDEIMATLAELQGEINNK
jgi:hypothetical protein